MGVVSVVQRTFGRGFREHTVAVVVGAVVGSSAGVDHRCPRARRIVGKGDGWLTQGWVWSFLEETIQRVIRVGRRLAIEVRLGGYVANRIVSVGLKHAQRQCAHASAIESIVLIRRDPVSSIGHGRGSPSTRLAIPACQALKDLRTADHLE